MKVLTIASDALKLNPLTAGLNQAGIEAIGLSDIRAVGRAIAIERPDLVLVDGKILGCQVLVALRKEQPKNGVPVVFLTNPEEDTGLSAHFLTSGVAAIVSTDNGLDGVVAEIRQLFPQFFTKKLGLKPRPSRTAFLDSSSML
jgi:DNA-binding response OmpR family regulator